MLLHFCAHLCWHVLTWFLMRHFWLRAELFKSPSVCCFLHGEGLQFFCTTAPFANPLLKSFENQTDWNPQSCSSHTPVWSHRVPCVCRGVLLNRMWLHSTDWLNKPVCTIQSSWNGDYESRIQAVWSPNKINEMCCSQQVDSK